MKQSCILHVPHDAEVVRAPLELLDARIDAPRPRMIEPGERRIHQGRLMPSDIPTKNNESMVSLEFMSHVVGDLIYCGKCDFILGRRGEVAVDVKGGRRVQSSDLRAIRAYSEEYKPQYSIVVSNQSLPRQTDDGILILPWEEFLERLWDGDFVD